MTSEHLICIGLGILIGVVLAKKTNLPLVGGS